MSDDPYATEGMERGEARRGGRIELQNEKDCDGG